MNEQYRIEFSKQRFQRCKEAYLDSDYLILCERNNNNNLSWSWSTVPSQMGYWETMDEAIVYLFNSGCTTLRFYDLYAESFEESLVRVESCP
jgi:hypothetical protein